MVAVNMWKEFDNDVRIICRRVYMNTFIDHTGIII